MATRPPTQKVAREQDIQNAILQYFQYNKNYKLWRQNVGAVKYSTTNGPRFIRFGTPGSADITGIGPGGQRIEIEVKRPKGKPTDSQLEFGEMINSMGGKYLIVHSLEEAIRGLNEMD